MISNRPIRLWLAAGALTTMSAIGFLPGHASAAECYPIGSNCGTDTNGDGAGVSDTTPAPGQTVVIKIAPGTFDPGSTGTVTLGSSGRSLGTFTADSMGGATISVVIPADLAAGTYAVTVSGLAEGVNHSLTESVTVSAAATTATTAPATGANRSSAGSLPRTGSDVVVPAAAAGLALVAGGTVLKRSSKRSKA